MEDPKTHVQFAVSLTPDRDGFLRRTCSSCGRDFKTEIDAADLQWELAAQCRRMGVEIGDESGESDEAARLRCPYCGHEDDPSEMHTEATVTYLKRFVNRELVIPQLNKFSAGLEDLFGGGQSGGFLSISWKSTRTILPPRPIHGPEPPDFKIIDFLCCSKKIKLADTCTAIEACTYCGTPVGMIA